MTSRISRRDFLAASSALAAGALTRTTSARGDDTRAVGPNDTIVLGFIGVGGMGQGLLNQFQSFPDVEVAALCDVYETHLLKAKDAAKGRPETYKDFRKVLDRPDIDAVVVATPDHWHAIPTILACQAGKDVYCEKPLGHNIVEGRLMADAARKYRRITQMGNLIHAGETYRRMVEIVQSGALGRITKTRAWMFTPADRRDIGNPPDQDPPDGCDYDFWLGPAPQRPFNPNRFTFNWRYFWDYGGGILTDFCCHLIDPILWAMQVEAPETVAATGGRYALPDNGETPDTLEVIYHFNKGKDDCEGFDLVWSQSDHNGHGFEEMGSGILFQGTRGTLVGHYNTYKILPETGEEIEEPEPFLPRSPGHHREWIDAIKIRDPCPCHFEYGHRLTSIGILGNIALWSDEKIRWDAAAEQVTNHPEANRFLVREEYRSPWSLPKL